MTSDYYLGLDVGATRVHAATARHTSSGNERVEPFSSTRTAENLGVLIRITPEGGLEFGQGASTHPETLVGGLRCRIGTGIPFVVGGHRVDAEDAYAHLVAAVVAAVTDTEGVAPARLVLTHPVNWGAHRRNGVRRALEERCEVPFEMMPEAEAAAWGAIEQARAGDVWALYDLGGTSLDTAIVRWEEDRWTVLAGAFDTTPIGGIDVDDALVSLILTDTATTPGGNRPPTAALRLSSVAAKEALSTDTDAVVTADLGAGPATIRLTRHDVEPLIRALLDRTVLTLRETLNDGGVTVDDISGIILAGGSARIPLVAEHLSTALGLTVVAEPDPADLIAMGAARSALSKSRAQVPASESLTHPSDPPDTPQGARPAVLVPFVRPEQARLAMYAWRLVVASLIVVCVVYLAWAFTSDSETALFGLGPHSDAAVPGPGGR